MAAGSLRIFDEGRKPIGEVYPYRDLAAAWALDAPAPLTFTIPRNSLRWSTHWMDFLHRVEYHDESLPYVWVGVILVHEPDPVEVRITCMSAEWLLQKRFTDKWLQLIGTGGQIAQALLQQANFREPLGILPGVMDRAGPEYYSEHQLQRVSEALANLMQRSGGHSWIEKVGHAHRDPWSFRWALQRGSDKRGSVLVCGEIVDTVASRRTAEDLATFAHVLGGGTGPELWQRLYLPLLDQSARRVYSLLEELFDYNDIIDPVLLNQAGVSGLRRISRPMLTLGFNVDNRRSVWGKFWIGDTIRAIIEGVGYAGYDGPALVKGIQVNPETERLGLVVEVPQ